MKRQPFFTKAAAATLTLTAGISLAGPASAASPSSMLLGMFDGTGHTSDDMKAVTGKRPATKVLFSNFSDDSLRSLNNDLTNAWNEGAAPLLTFEFFTNNKQGDPHAGPYDGAAKHKGDHENTARVDKNIAEGKLDSRIDRAADTVRTFVAGPDNTLNTQDDRKVYIRPGHEMNGTWYRWSATANQTPTDYVNAFRHIHERFDHVGLTNKDSIQYIWSPMSCGSINDCDPTHLARGYYPGDRYVDWVGVDAYNWGNARSSGWQSPETIMKQALDEVSNIAPSKPLTIPETGVPSNAGGDKNQWFNDLYGFTSYYISPQKQRIKMLNYFNIEKKEDGTRIDWTAINSADDHRFPAFNSLARHDNYIGGNKKNHISTAQFQGR